MPVHNVYHIRSGFDGGSSQRVWGAVWGLLPDVFRTPQMVDQFWTHLVSHHSCNLLSAVSKNDSDNITSSFDLIWLELEHRRYCLFLSLTPTFAASKALFERVCKDEDVHPKLLAIEMDIDKETVSACVPGQFNELRQFVRQRLPSVECVLIYMPHDFLPCWLLPISQLLKGIADDVTHANGLTTRIVLVSGPRGHEKWWGAVESWRQLYPFPQRRIVHNAIPATASTNAIPEIIAAFQDALLGAKPSHYTFQENTTV